MKVLLFWVLIFSRRQKYLTVVLNVFFPIPMAESINSLLDEVGLTNTCPAIFKAVADQKTRGF